jgi:hypothetical protein
MECKGVGSRPARNRRSSQLLSNLGCARLHIATRRPSRIRQEACCLRALHPGPGEIHRASAPAHAAARGGLAPPLACDGTRPTKTAVLAFTAPATMNRLGLAWASTTRLRRRVIPFTSAGSFTLSDLGSPGPENPSASRSGSHHRASFPKWAALIARPSVSHRLDLP